MSKASEKQLKFIIYLIGKYYRNDNEKAKSRRELLFAKMESGDYNLSKKDASKAIDIMKNEVNAYENAMHYILRGGVGSTYYASMVDIWDDSDEKTLNEIWDRL